MITREELDKVEKSVAEACGFFDTTFPVECWETLKNGKPVWVIRVFMSVKGCFYWGHGDTLDDAVSCISRELENDIKKGTNAKKRKNTDTRTRRGIV